MSGFRWVRLAVTSLDAVIAALNERLPNIGGTTLVEVTSDADMALQAASTAYLADTSSGGVTLALPAPVGAQDKHVYVRRTAGGGSLTVTGEGDELPVGLDVNTSALFASNGARWVRLL